MNRHEIALLEHASRSVMACDTGETVADPRAHAMSRVMTAAVPAFGILAACAVMLLNIV